MAKFEVNWLDDTSNDGLITELLRVASLIADRRLTKREFDTHSRINSSTIERRFGNWGAATRQAGLTGALPVYNWQDVLDDIGRVAQNAGDRRLTISFYKQNGRYSPSLVKRTFGGWLEALTNAGFGDRYSGPVITESMKTQDGRQTTKEDIIAILKKLAERLGKNSLSATEIEKNSSLRQPLIYKRFGSLLAALRAAGLEPVAHGKRYTEDEIFDNLREVWIHYGRAPTVVEMSSTPSTVGANVYLKRFGGWRKALRVFIEQANSEVDDEPLAIREPSNALATSTDTIGTTPATSAQPLPKPKPPAPKRLPPEERRQPSKGLRFKIFHRDKFTCKLCGIGPPNCILHVDHITPFANGGKTTVENLRTLCAACNIGRGNRYDV